MGEETSSESLYRYIALAVLALIPAGVGSGIGAWHTALSNRDTLVRLEKSQAEMAQLWRGTVDAMHIISGQIGTVAKDAEANRRDISRLERKLEK